MNTLQKYIPFFASALLMGVVLFIIYPHYQYYVDPDGTAYLTISQRYANGDYIKAINGYWSPWSCWLTALLIKTGLAAIPASVVINAVGAAGFLFISQSFFLRFDIIRKLQWLLNITLAFFLCYAIFWQSFDDLWECFFLLSTLRLMLVEDFKSKQGFWVICGVIGSLAYFAKAYSFPFFILNTICCTYFICKDNKVQWIKISLTAIAVMIICSLPWIWALHNKYGIWTTSTAGSLNMSWYLVGHPHWKEGIVALLPPPYPDSPYYWEDPWFVNGDTPHFWDSWHLFGLQILRIGLNIWKFIVSMMQMSVFVPLIMVVLIRFVVKTRDIYVSTFTVALSFLLFSPGYLLINFEPRYIWYMVPLSMLAGTLFILNHLNSNNKIFKVMPYLFAVSYLIYPAWGLYEMYDVGKQEYGWAQKLRENNVHGTFTTKSTPGIETQRAIRIAYFSGNKFYAAPNDSFTKEQLLKEVRRYQIKYFIVCSYESMAFADIVELTDEQGVKFPSKYIGDNTDVKVIFLNPQR